MKKLSPGDTPVDEIAAALVAVPQVEDLPAEELPPEVMPARGGSYIRLPDGTLQREEEA